MSKRLLLVGGGGHCLGIIEALSATERRNAGVVDLPVAVGKKVNELPVVGADSDLSLLSKDYDAAFVSLGSIGNWQPREALAHKIDACGYKVPRIIHPSAVVSPSAQLSRGVYIAASAVINAKAEIGPHCILNTGCIVEHGCLIEEFAHIAPGAVLCGEVRIGKGSHIGANSVVKQGVSIGANCLIGMGSVVLSDLPDNTVAYGNPCRAQQESSC